ncbi:transcription termination/antitermination protein NusA [Candidatus Saganbacteria bacterium]|nr:transcription termination/antitermination protein NusA [Candidatus Saganbacteria bacterium]
MLAEIEKDRGIKEIDLLNAIKDAMISAYKKRFPTAENLEATISDQGETSILANLVVAKTVNDPLVEISLKDVKKDNKDVKVGDTVKLNVTPKDFGRLAAQTAKQVIIQRIREAEKEGTFEEYQSKIRTLITGTVQNREHGGYLVNIGRIETFLTFTESMPTETLRPKDKVKLIILDVKKTPKGPMIVVSRSHPDLIRRLFEFEIPEITQGILEIKAIAREAGRRTKVAVYSNDKNIGAVGTCVGPMGSRIQNVTRELGPERVDIIEWSQDDSVFISHSLSPAKVSKVELNKTEKTVRVILPEKEFSLAIGKEGQNVRLAAKLTGYKIDIISEEMLAKEKDDAKEAKKESEKVVKLEAEKITESEQ